jgi:hypothetical protein
MQPDAKSIAHRGISSLKGLTRRGEILSAANEVAAEDDTGQETERSD